MMHRIALILFSLALTAHSENLYVTPSGAGASNGSDWSNAFAGFSDVAWGSGAGQLGAGDTLWVAGGSYNTSLELKGSGTEGNLINIKRARATDSECSGSAGWSAGYDAQVVISATWPILIDNSSLVGGGGGRYCVVDGRITNGILCNFPNSPGARGISIDAYDAFHTTFRYLDVAGPATVIGYSFTNDVRCVVIETYDGRANVNRPSHITIEYCTLHGACDTAILGHVSNFIFRNNESHTIDATDGYLGGIRDEAHGIHQNTFYVMSSDNVTIANNTFHNIGPTTGLFFTGFGSDGGVQSSNVFIYGNVFRDTDYSASRFVHVREGATGTGPIYVYNNTVASGYWGFITDSVLNPNAESYVRNNLFVDLASNDITLPGGEDYVTIDHNITTNSYAMFVSAGGTNVLAAPYAWQWVRDLHIVTNSAPVNAGVDLGAPFNTDMDGVTRGADGTWDVGAYELASSGEITPDTTNPSIAITSPSDDPHSNGTSTSITVSGTASDNVGVASVTWSNGFGGSGTATGTTSWSATVALQSGTNTVTVTAHDAAANTASDTVVVIVVTPAPEGTNTLRTNIIKGKHLRKK